MSETRYGELYMIPTVIADNTTALVTPPVVLQSIEKIRHFLCEEIRTARRFVSSLKVHPHIEEVSFQKLDKDTPEDALTTLMQPLFEGHPVGILSESGCPGIADPGAAAVRYAHQHGIKVIPLAGPSSLLLALMASGMNGQRFAFHGYLPVESKERAISIRNLEKESAEKNQTQIFIETPYRNNVLLKELVQHLRSDTELCVGYNITGTSESIQSKLIKDWKKDIPYLDKEPAVFLFLAHRNSRG